MSVAREKLQNIFAHRWKSPGDFFACDESNRKQQGSSLQLCFSTRCLCGLVQRSLQLPRNSLGAFCRIVTAIRHTDLKVGGMASAEERKRKVSASNPEIEEGEGEGDVIDGKPSSNAGELSTTDVFEIAAELSSECAKIGNRFGQDTVVKIVPCVVRVLEELEFAVERAELLTADLVEAQHEAAQAKAERDREVTYRRKVESVSGTYTDRQD